MADTLTAEEWRDRLLDKYASDLAVRVQSAAYYDNVNTPPAIAPNLAEAYLRLLGRSKTPWGQLVIDIVAERLVVQAFAFDGDTENLWRSFRRNRMEFMQKQVHREALALGTSYASVWPSEKDPNRAKIAYETGMLVTHETVPGDPHETAASLKSWFDPTTSRLRTNLYLPDRVVRYISSKKVDERTMPRPEDGIGQPVHNVDWDVIETVTNPYGQVTMQPFPVRPDWRGYGVSDIEPVAPVIDRIESITANTLLAVELGAFRQKWTTGLEVPRNPETGDPVEPFKAAIDRLWVSEAPDTKFGAFDATDIRPYLSAVSDAVAQLSAVSRIPTLYFNQSDLSNPPSADSLEASETGLINKVRDRQDTLAEAWERVAGIALQIEGAGEVDEIEVNWRDPRTRSESQTMDAATKLQLLGVPWEEVMAFVGYTPGEIARLRTARAADTFDRLLNTPLPSATRIEEPASNE